MSSSGSLRWKMGLSIVVLLASASAACAAPEPVVEETRATHGSIDRPNMPPSGPRIPGGGDAPRPSIGGGGDRTPCMRAPCDPQPINQNDGDGRADPVAMSDPTAIQGSTSGDRGNEREDVALGDENNETFDVASEPSGDSGDIG